MLTELQRIAGGHIKATFNEREISFRSPTLSDLCEFEETFGPIDEAFSNKPRGKGQPAPSKLKPLRFLLWRSMLHDEPDLTIEDAGNRFTMADMSEDGPAIEIINMLMPEGTSPKALQPGQAKQSPAGGS